MLSKACEIEWMTFRDGFFDFTNTAREEEITGVEEENLIIDEHDLTYEIDGILDIPEIDEKYTDPIAEIERRSHYQAYPYHIQDGQLKIKPSKGYVYFFMLALYLQKADQYRTDFEFLSAELLQAHFGDAFVFKRLGWPIKHGSQDLLSFFGEDYIKIDKSSFQKPNAQKDFGIDFGGYMKRNIHDKSMNWLCFVGQAASGGNYMDKLFFTYYYNNLLGLKISPTLILSCCAVLSEEEKNEIANRNNLVFDRLQLLEIAKDKKIEISCNLIELLNNLKKVN